ATSRGARPPRPGAEAAREVLGGFDLEDLVLQLGAARGCDLDGLALLLADDRLTDRRFVGELVLGRIRLGGAHDVVFDRLLGGNVPQPDVRADAHDVLRDLLLVDHPRCQQTLFELRDPVLHHPPLRLRSVVLGVLGDVAELPGDADSICDLAPLLGREVLDLLLQLLVTLGSEDHFLHKKPPQLPTKKPRAENRPSRGRHGTYAAGGRQTHSATISRSMQVNLTWQWQSGLGEIPSRVVVAPMAGGGLRAFRREWGRWGAGLVCSEMVSCAGL